MIEQSVLEPYEVKSFHIVAHSLGCILALALAVKHPGSVKSLTLLAPVSSYFFPMFFFAVLFQRFNYPRKLITESFKVLNALITD
jgi:pimeloyl-ACP methyl ester carboxylesterase